MSRGRGDRRAAELFPLSPCPSVCLLSLILWFWAKNKRRPPTLRFTPHPVTKTEPPACSLEPQQRGASKEPRCRGDGQTLSSLRTIFTVARIWPPGSRVSREPETHGSAQTTKTNRV